MVYLVTVSTLFLIMMISGAKIEAQMNQTVKENNLEEFTIGKKIYDAASRGNLAEVKNLCDQCFGVNWQNIFKSTPLHAAALNNHPEIVMFLLSCNADPNSQTITGWTPLMYASRSADVDVVNALLTASPKLDVQKFDGWTALMLAANNNRVGNAKAIISAGANLDLKNGFGKTAANIARKRGSLDILKLLSNETGNKTTTSTNNIVMLMFLAFVGFIAASVTIGGCLHIATKITRMPPTLQSLMVFTIEEDREILHINKDS